MKNPTPRSRAAKSAVGGFVLLASLLIPAGATHASDVETGNGGMETDRPANVPSGWIGSSVQWSELHDSMYMVDGVHMGAAPAAAPMFLDVYASTTSVSAPGEVVEYLVRVRRALPYIPHPVLAPDFVGLTRKNFYGTVDLSELSDNAAPLTLADLRPADNAWAGLSLSLEEGKLAFAGTFPDTVDTLEFRFSIEYAGTGDNNLDVSASAIFTDAIYKPVGRTGVVVRAQEPPLEIVKRASTPKVTAVGEEVTYTIDVTRPAGNKTAAIDFRDDFSGISDDIAPLKASDIRISGVEPETTATIGDDTISFAAGFAAPVGQTGTQSVQYTVTYTGGGDDVLTNVACAAPLGSASASRMSRVAISEPCAEVTTLAEVSDGEVPPEEPPPGGSEAAADGGQGSADAGSTPDAGVDASADAAPDADAISSGEADAETDGGDGSGAGADASEGSGAGADAAADEPSVGDEEQVTPDDESEASASMLPAQPETGNLPGSIAVAGVGKDLANTGSAAAPWLLGAAGAIALGAGATVAARRQRQH